MSFLFERRDEEIQPEISGFLSERILLHFPSVSITKTYSPYSTIPKKKKKKEAEVFNSAEFEETYIFFCDFLGAEKHNAGKISIKQKKKSFFIKFSK